MRKRDVEAVRVVLRMITVGGKLVGPKTRCSYTIRSGVIGMTFSDVYRARASPG